MPDDTIVLEELVKHLLNTKVLSPNALRGIIGVSQVRLDRKSELLTHLQELVTSE
jgi:hypothetical protein